MKPSIIELKLKDTEKTSWKTGLSSYLKKIYGTSQWSKFYNEKYTSRLDHLRDNANGELSFEAHLEQNMKYQAFLEHLYIRLGSNKNKSFKMDFTWYETEYFEEDSVEPIKYTQNNLAFEKACTLFNIATILVNGTNEKLNLTDYKDSIRMMTRAMSCFEYLADNFLNPPSYDLQTETLQLLIDLCHAQAQEMFVIKLINDEANNEKQASLISKLAVTTTGLFEKCHEALGMPGDETKESYGDPTWRSRITCKWHLFKALSAYYHSLFLEQQNKAGEAIAFAKLAEKEIQEAGYFRAKMSDYVDFDSFKTTISEKIIQLNKDNDFIYHDPIPPSVSLDTIKKMDAIKSEPWMKQLEPYMEKNSEKADELFKGIVPMDIYQKESIYSEKKANILRQQMDNSETANWEYKSFIEFTNLPTLLNNLTKKYQNNSATSDEDPQIEMMRGQLTSYINFVKNSPYKDIDTRIKEIFDKIKEITDLLPLLPDDQKANVVQLKMSLVEASHSDEKLFSMITPYKEDIKLLSESDSLWKKFNSFNPPADTGPSLLDIDDHKTETILKGLKEVKNLSEELRLLKEERERNVDQIKNDINNDDITKLLLFSSGKSSAELESLFDQELKKFEPLSTRIEATIFKQSSTINEIKMKLDEIFTLTGFQEKSKEEKELAKSRKEFFDKIQLALTNFQIFSTDFSKGLQFYESLLEITKDLLNSTQKSTLSASTPRSSSPITNTMPPPLPPQPKTMSSEFKKLNITTMLPPNVNAINFNSPSVTTPMHFPIQTQIPTPTAPRKYTTSTPQSPLPPQYSEAPPHYTQNSPMSFPVNTKPYHPQIPVPGQVPVPRTTTQVPVAHPTSYFPPADYRSNVMPAPQLSGPPKPPKQPAANPALKKQKEEKEQRELQRNPTAFYNNPSVFDEDLYSRFSS